jgi:hypothetical protein
VTERDREMARDLMARVSNGAWLDSDEDKVIALVAAARREGLEQARDWWPEHKCSLTICHNPHKDVYETVVQYEGEDPVWASAEDRAQAIATNELWEMQWYPETPAGFVRVYAATYEGLRAAIREAAK